MQQTVITPAHGAMPHVQTTTNGDRPSNLQIHLLGSFTVISNGQTLVLPATEDAQRLLAYLLIHPQRTHLRSFLAATFWPDWAESEARRQLTRVLWRVRNGSPLAPFITANAQSITLHSKTLWIDLHEFMSCVTTALENRAPGQETAKAVAERSTKLALAVNLYQGHLLPGLYDDWLLSEQQRVTHLYTSALAELVRRLKHQGQFQAALTYAQQLAQVDPLDEANQREIIRLYLALQQPKAALEHYQSYTAYLQAEMAVEPEPVTAALAQQIRRQLSYLGPTFNHLAEQSTTTPPALAAPNLHLPLLGREKERQQLLLPLNALFAESADSGGIILVEGEAGMGKTRLLRDLADDLAWRGAEVLWHNAERTPGEPYAPFIDLLEEHLTALRVTQVATLAGEQWFQILRHWLPHLGAWLTAQPLLSHLESHLERERLSEALAQLFSGWAQLTPLLIVFDNAHLWTPDCLDLLRYLIGRVQPYRLLFVVSYRTFEARQDETLWSRIRTLADVGLRTRLSLTPLPLETTSFLVRASLATIIAQPELEERIHAETHGNPLFVLEMVQTLFAQGLLVYTDEQQWCSRLDQESAPDGLFYSQSLEEVITQRLQRLPGREQSVLQWLAILGYTVNLNHLQRLSTYSMQEVLAALTALQKAGVLQEVHSGYEFRHAKLQQAAYAAIPPPLRQQLHQRAAYLLESEDRKQHSALLRHAEQGSLWDRAIEYAVQAAQDALAFNAFATALAYYDKALALLAAYMPPAIEQPTRLHFDILDARHSALTALQEYEQRGAELITLVTLAERLGEPVRLIKSYLYRALTLTGQPDKFDDAITFLQRALLVAEEHNLPAQVALVQLKTGYFYLLISRFAEAVAPLQQSQRLWAQLPGGERSLAESYYHLANVHWSLSQLPEAEAAARQILALPHVEHDLYHQLWGYLMLALVARRRGDSAANLAHNLEALGRAEQLGLRGWGSLIQGNLAATYQDRCEYPKALACLQESLTIERALDSRWGILSVLCSLLDIYLQIGQYEAVRPLLPEAFAIDEKFNASEWRVRLCWYAARLAYHDQQVTEANAYLEQALTAAEAVAMPQLLSFTYLERGDLRWQQQRYQDALRDFEAALDGVWAPMLPLLHAWIARTYLLLDDRSAAQQISAQAVIEVESAQQLVQDPQVVYLCRYQVLTAHQQFAVAQAALEQAYQHLHAKAAHLTDPAWRASFLSGIPDHAAIMAAYDARLRQVSSPTPTAQTSTVHLARADAPAFGRALEDNEWVEVVWTVYHPDDAALSKPSVRRQQQLLRLLQEAQEQAALPTITDLATALRVSVKTIQRDLQQLRQQQSIPPTKGG